MPLSKDELQALLNDVQLDESVLDGIINLVQTKVDEVREELSEQAQAYGDSIREDMQEQLDQIETYAQAYGDHVKETMTENVDEYVQVVLDDYIKENSEKFEKLEKFARMESVFEDVKTAFETNGFALNENVELETAKKDLEIAETAYNEVYESLKEAREELETSQMALLFETKTRDLTDVQRDKIKTLSENVSFEGPEEFDTALGLLITQVKGSKQSLTENTDPDPTPKGNGDRFKAILEAL